MSELVPLGKIWVLEERCLGGELGLEVIGGANKIVIGPAVATGRKRGVGDEVGSLAGACPEEGLADRVLVVQIPLKHGLHHHDIVRTL